MPYIFYCLQQSDQRLDLSKINTQERKLLNNWRKKGYIFGGACRMEVTKVFWDTMSDLIYLAYVNID